MTNLTIEEKINGLFTALELVLGRVENLEALSTALMQEMTRVQGRELYMCADEIIWHRDGDRMIPLNDEGEHVDPDALHNRGSVEVQRMRRRTSFPTFTQLQEINRRNDNGRLVETPLVRVTELDVVKLHVRRLEAQIRELAE